MADPLLVQAIMNGDIEMFNQLVEQGADINEKDGIGSTPLMVAILMNQTEMAKALIFRGCDVRAKNGTGGETAIHDAIGCCNVEVVDLLLQRGVALSEKDIFLSKKINNILIIESILKHILRVMNHHIDGFKMAKNAFDILDGNNLSQKPTVLYMGQQPGMDC